jgi:hypothetical protein
MKQFSQTKTPRLFFGMMSAASVLAAIVVMPVQAQDTTQARQPSGDKCVARPDQDPQVQRPDVQGGTTQKLAECNSVLKPPAVGDPEMVEPAPSVGETPVIKPRELPPEQTQDRTLNKG